MSTCSIGLSPEKNEGLREETTEISNRSRHVISPGKNRLNAYASINLV